MEVVVVGAALVVVVATVVVVVGATLVVVVPTEVVVVVGATLVVVVATVVVVVGATLVVVVAVVVVVVGATLVVVVVGSGVSDPTFVEPSNDASPEYTATNGPGSPVTEQLTWSESLRRRGEQFAMAAPSLK